MSHPPIIEAFVAGALTAAFLVAGLFFLRFWRRSKDSFFLIFAIAFALMAATQAAPIVFGIADESRSQAYLMRLAAFAMIIFAILRKNMSK